MIPNERLRHHRLQRGWTLDAVAQRLDALAPTVGKKHLGVNGTMVGRWERGERQPRGIYRGLLATLYETITQDLGLYEPATSEKTIVTVFLASAIEPECTTRSACHLADGHVTAVTVTTSPARTTRAQTPPTVESWRS